MIVIILAVFTIIIAVVVFLNAYDFLDGFLGAVVTLVVGGLVTLGAVGISNVLPVTSTETQTTPLKAIGHSSNTQGSFFLGTGYVDEKPSYSYYEDHDNYSELKTVETRNTRIYEDGKKEVTYNIQHRNHWWWAGDTSNIFRIDFHVPENSIVETTKLDLSQQ